MARLALQLVLLAATQALLGCGAPTESASDVQSLFLGPAPTLQDKVSNLCDQLYVRSEEPTLDGVDLDLDGCQDAGLVAANLKEVTEFDFVGLDAEAPDQADESIINRSVRAQIWLNKSLLGLAGAIAKKIQESKEAGDNEGLISLPESDATQGLEGLATLDLEVLEEPSFDLERVAFSAALHLAVTGAVEVDNVIRIAGGLIDNNFAVVVASEGRQPYEKSLIRDFSAAILVVPHAGDIYVDLLVNVNIHNPGLASMVKEQVSAFLGTGLKGIIDGISAL